MHPDVGLGGFVYWFVIVLFGGTALLSAFMIVDAARRRAEQFGTRPWTRFVYIGIGLAFFATMAVGFQVTVTTSVALITSVVYLLRVVFPTPERLAARQPESELDQTESEFDASQSDHAEE